MAKLTSTARVEALLDHLALTRVHVAACMSGDWGDLLGSCADRLTTLTIVAPHMNKGVPPAIGTVSIPALVIAGDEGEAAERARSLATAFRHGELVKLRRYSSPMWADTVAERATEVRSAVFDFLERAQRARPLPEAGLPQREGAFEGIRYRIRGHGPPLLLFPLSMAPSQWEPLIDELSARYCTVSLTGPHLGPVPLLESRFRSGYGELALSLVHAAESPPGAAVLEVGCGSGALSRALAARADKPGRFVATDLNGFLLAEARALADSEGIGDRISFEEANAEALPYPEGQFDLAISCTVMEEGDADRMLRELARVTRANGRVVIMTRAVDVDWCVNIPVSHALRKKLNSRGPTTGAGVGVTGCADASIYLRAMKTGLNPVSMGPRFAVYRHGERLEDVLARLNATLSADEVETCRDAIELAGSDGTLFVAEPFHCIIGEAAPRSP